MRALMSPGYRPLPTITIATLVALIILASPRPAQAHTIPAGACGTYRLIHTLVTGSTTLGRRAYRRCVVAKAVHEGTHRCVNASSSASWSTCRGAVRAARARTDTPDAWAWNASLHTLWEHESTWRPNAINASSGACGIPQRLPCPWPVDNGIVGAPAFTQTANGYGYVLGRYGTPEAALAHFREYGWY